MNRLYLPFIVMVAYALVTFYTEHYLLTESVYFQAYSAQISDDKIAEIIDFNKKWSWLSYVALPVLYFFKVSLISSCTYVGLFLVCGNKVRLRDVFPAVIKADMVFLVPVITKLIWFTFYTDYTFEDIQYFMPGSLLNFFEQASVEKWLIYPLQAFNIFELAFWFILAYQLKGFFKNDFTLSFQTVALSYGSSFVVWVVFVVFITLNLT